jgi:recombination protein RecT
MNTAVAIKTKPNPFEDFRVQVLPPDKAADLWRSLPAHIKPEVFDRNLVNALMANPDLMRFGPLLIFREVSKAAGLGLLLDPLLGEAYIVPAYNYKSKSVEPQLRVGYRGMCKLARQSGGVTGIYAHEVCKNDFVECDMGFPKVLHHRPELFGDRGNVIGYLAVITYSNGGFDFEPMSVEQARGIRDRSDAWKAFSEKKIKSTPWETDEAEMSKKTTLRRLMKRQDLSPEMRRAIEIEDEAEFPSMRHEPRPVTPKPPAPMNETEVEEVGPAEPVKAPTPNDTPAKAGAAPAATTPSPNDEPTAFITWIDTKLAGATANTLETIWNDEIAPRLDELPPLFQEDALGVYRKHEARVEP